MQKIFITGASKGIGKGLATKYASLGDEVFITSRNEVALKEVSELINSQSGKSYYKTCNVNNSVDVKDTVNEAFHKLGRIDVAYLNAGINNRVSFINFDIEIFRDILETNLYGLLNCLESLIPIMFKQGSGVLVGISSIADFKGIPHSAAYNVSKIGISYLLDAARAELKEKGIDVITVRPGYVRTDMINQNNFNMPLILEIEDCVERIVDGVSKRKKVISFPLPLVIVTNILKLFPAGIWDFLIKFWYKHFFKG